MKIYAFLLLILLSSSFLAQDNKSQAILDDLSKSIKSMSSIYVEFSASIKNTSSGQNENEIGKGWVKGKKYFASFGENTVISNGIKTWMVVKEEGSIYESDASNGDDALSPKRILSIWENGFKNSYSKETTLNGQAVHEIKLNPTAPAKSDYHTIFLYISKKNELKRAILKGNDGTVMTYTLNKLTANPSIDDNKFLLERNKYPGYPVIRD